MSDDVAAFARTLRALWLGMAGSAAVLVVVCGWLATEEPASMPEHADAAFYLVALLSAVGTAGAFAVHRAMEARLFRAGTEAEAASTLQTYGVLALAVAEVPAIAAAAAAFLTGETLALSLAVPFFAFLALTWPSDARVAGWLSLRNL